MTAISTTYLVRSVPPNAVPRVRIGHIVSIFAVMVAAGIAAYLGLFLAAAVIYAALFIALAFISPRYAMLLVFATAPFAWDVGGGPVKMAASELSLVALLPLVLLSARSGQWKRLNNPFWLAVTGYFLVCIFSTAANGSLFTGFTSLLQMAVYCVFTVLVFSVGLKNWSQVFPAFYGLMITCAFISILMLVDRSNFVLGLHKNLAGTELMYAVLIGLELWIAGSARKQAKKGLTVLLAIVIIGLVASCSRGAWMGTFVGVLVILLLRRQYTIAARVCLLIVPIIVFGWFLLGDKAKDSALALGLDSNSGSGGARLVSAEYAYGIFLKNPIYGEGVGLRKEYDATNVVLSTLAETGVMGAITFLSIYAALFYMAWKTQKRIARTDQHFSLLTIGMALMMGKLAHGCVDHFWARGVVPVWAGAGLVVFAYTQAKRIDTRRVARTRP